MSVYRTIGPLVYFLSLSNYVMSVKFHYISVLGTYMYLKFDIFILMLYTQALILSFRLVAHSVGSYYHYQIFISKLQSVVIIYSVF